MRHLRRVGTGLWVVIATMLLAAVVLVRLAGANGIQAMTPDRRMALSEFQPLHERQRVLVIDVRDADSFANGHIPGAMHVPVRDVASQLAVVRKAAKGRLIVAYCSCPTEGSSLRAAGELSDAGLNAKALVGGFPKWVAAGGAIEK